jgi:hypothetical protein
LQEQSVIVTVHKFVPEKDTIDPVSGKQQIPLYNIKELFIINKNYIYVHSVQYSSVAWQAICC